MRLSDILSQPQNNEFKSIESFLNDKELKQGKQRKINIGKIVLSYFCKNCNDILSFYSDDPLYCIGIDKHTISIDCVLKCVKCNNSLIKIWFLVSSEGDIYSNYPKVKILRKNEDLSNAIFCNNMQFEEYNDLLYKAEIAHQNKLGAGANIYLRKIFESAVEKVALVYNVPILQETNDLKKRKFFKILKDINEKAKIIPNEFSNNGYKLFEELSNLIHSDSNDEEALEKYQPLKRLIIGVLDNIKNNKEISIALEKLKWNLDGEKNGK